MCSNKAVEKTKEIIREKNAGADEADIDETAKTVGIGAVIFQELSNNRIKDYVFKWDKVLNFDGETGPYVQYTHARCASVLRRAGEETVAKAAALKDVDYKYLCSESAYELIKLLYKFPDVVVDAGHRYEPSIVTRHIVDMAQGFQPFLSRRAYSDRRRAGKRRQRWLWSLPRKNAIRNGLALLGMKAPEKM